jgi:hypothetical protein
MSDEKKATLKKVLMAVMSVGALGRAPVHAATPQPARANGHVTAQTDSQAVATAGAAQALADGDVQFTDAFHDVFNNADPYVQTFGDLFVLEGPFLEFSCW